MKKLLLLIVIFASSLCINYSFAQGYDENYKGAVNSAKIIFNAKENRDNLLGLVSLTNKAPAGEFKKTDTVSNVQWCLNTDTMIYVTMFCAVGSHYDKFQVDSKANTNGYASWVTTPNELNKKLSDITGITNELELRKRLARILGMPIPADISKLQSKIITFKVPQSRLFRPAFNPNPNTDIANYTRDTTYSLLNWPEYNKWFKEKCDETFPPEGGEATSSHYPFTGLGYTYDWGDRNSTIYGLSEFVIIPHTEVTIVGNQTLWDYYEALTRARNQQ